MKVEIQSYFFKLLNSKFSFINLLIVTTFLQDDLKTLLKRGVF